MHLIYVLNLIGINYVPLGEGYLFVDKLLCKFKCKFIYIKNKVCSKWHVSQRNLLIIIIQQIIYETFKSLAIRLILYWLHPTQKVTDYLQGVVDI